MRLPSPPPAPPPLAAAPPRMGTASALPLSSPPTPSPPLAAAPPRLGTTAALPPPLRVLRLRLLLPLFTCWGGSRPCGCRRGRQVLRVHSFYPRHGRKEGGDGWKGERGGGGGGKGPAGMSRRRKEVGGVGGTGEPVGSRPVAARCCQVRDDGLRCARGRGSCGGSARARQ